MNQQQGIASAALNEPKYPRIQISSFGLMDPWRARLKSFSHYYLFKGKKAIIFLKPLAGKHASQSAFANSAAPLQM